MVSSEATADTEPNRAFEKEVGGCLQSDARSSTAQSREDLFDSLRLGTRVHFDAVLPEPTPMMDVTVMSGKELVELALATLPSYAAYVTGIRAWGKTRNRWTVEAKLDESRYTTGITVTLTVETYNTKNRRDSGELMVSWEAKESS